MKALIEIDDVAALQHIGSRPFNAALVGILCGDQIDVETLSKLGLRVFSSREDGEPYSITWGKYAIAEYGICDHKLWAYDIHGNNCPGCGRDMRSKQT